MATITTMNTTTKNPTIKISLLVVVIDTMHKAEGYDIGFIQVGQLSIWSAVRPEKQVDPSAPLFPSAAFISLFDTSDRAAARISILNLHPYRDRCITDHPGQTTLQRRFCPPYFSSRQEVPSIHHPLDKLPLAHYRPIQGARGVQEKNARLTETTEFIETTKIEDGILRLKYLQKKQLRFSNMTRYQVLYISCYNFHISRFNRCRKILKCHNIFPSVHFHASGILHYMKQPMTQASLAVWDDVLRMCYLGKRDNKGNQCKKQTEDGKTYQLPPIFKAFSFWKY